MTIQTIFAGIGIIATWCVVAGFVALGLFRLSQWQ
jgi:hypothetical protein